MTLVKKCFEALNGTRAITEVVMKKFLALTFFGSAKMGVLALKELLASN